MKALVSNFEDGTPQLAEESPAGRPRSLGRAKVRRAPKRIAFLHASERDLAALVHRLVLHQRHDAKSGNAFGQIENPCRNSAIGPSPSQSSGLGRRILFSQIGMSFVNCQIR